VRSNDGAMNGLEFARCTTAGGFDRVLIHAAPGRAKIEVIADDDRAVARAELNRSIRDGRNVGYAPATINRRLAAVSGLFGYQAMRDPAAPCPIPRRAEARRAAAGERSGLLAHLARPKRRSGLRVREPRRLPRGLDRASPPRCWRASAPIRKGVPDH
jgi:integrase